MATYYKWLNEDGSAPFSHWKWPLPRNDGTPGRWTQRVKKLVHCEQGYHLCLDNVDSLLTYIGLDPMPRVLYVVQPKPGAARAMYDDKMSVKTARLVERVGVLTRFAVRLFAADCAERVLPVFEQTYPLDDGPRRAINAVRQYARGEADAFELLIAGILASNAAARALEAGDRAAWLAALAAADATHKNTPLSTSDTAIGAVCAKAAAEDGAQHDARYTAESSMRSWQLQRLLGYVREEVA